MLATIALSYWVISKEAAATGYSYHLMQHGSHSTTAATTTVETGAGMWTVTFAYYCLLIHFLVFLFPIRSCWSIIDITRTMKKTARSKTLRDIKLSHRRRGSSTSLSSSETLTSSRDGSTTGSEAGDIDLEPYTDGESNAAENVIHVIIIPNYKEEVDTLRETLDVLASHPQARYSYDVSDPLFSISVSSWFSNFNMIFCTRGLGLQA
jgi:hypothetical protein